MDSPTKPVKTEEKRNKKKKTEIHLPSSGPGLTLEQAKVLKDFEQEATQRFEESLGSLWR